LIVVAMTLAACSGGDHGGRKPGGGPRSGGTLRYGADQAVTTFNPWNSKAVGRALGDVVIRVLPQTFIVTPAIIPQYDKDLLTTEPVAAMVGGKQVVTYTLRPAAIWSDGVPINSDDFFYLWKSQETKGFDASPLPGLDLIESVTGRGADKKTVVVTFGKPFADWRMLFNDILPAHYMIAQQPRYGGPAGAWENALNTGIPVSGGPWKVASVDATRRIVTLARNDRYWARKPYLDRIVYQAITESSVQPAALKNGEVDMILSQPQLDLVRQIRALAPAVTSQVDYTLAWEHLDMNTRNRFLSDVNVRRAIAYGIDRTAIVKAGPAQFDSRARVLNNRIWLNNQPQYRDNAGAYATRNVGRAKQLLAQSGYTIGPDGYATKDGRELTLRFSTTRGNKLREDTGVLIQSQLRDIGIKIVMDNVPADVLFGDRLEHGNFDLTLFAFAGGPYPSLNDYFYRSATPADPRGNFGLLSDPRIDKLIDQSAGEQDQGKLAAEWNQVDVYAWQDMVTIPLYQKPQFLAYRFAFGSIVDNVSSSGLFWNSQDFYQK